MRNALLWLIALACTRVPLAAQAVDFEREVLPILEQRCFDCHSEPKRDSRGRLRKPKGDLRVDGRSFLERGGDGGQVLVPHEPGKSSLYARTVLPKDDPDVMPERGERLSAAETALLERWIREGAKFGDWVGKSAAVGVATNPASDPATTRTSSVVSLRLAVRERLSQGLAPASESVMTALGAVGARVEDLTGDRRLFTIGFEGARAATNDKSMRPVVAAGANVHELDLARTGITDAALIEVARLPRLVRLDLSGTAVSHRGIARLVDANELRSLVLVETKVDGAIVDSLLRMPALESVHLWRTGLREEDLARLRASKPSLRVIGAPALPPPATGDESGGRRRRR
ncbi:MAG: c-type cytochrome domain-containing protein [Planctomycetota bacterium]